MSKELKHKIYLPGDCLSEKMLFDYIDNKLHNKERHIVEKHLLDCEMCSDALEGLELVKDRNRISIIKEAINKRVLEATEKEAIVVSFNYKLVFSIAATIALLIVGVFFFNKMTLKESDQSDMAELKIDKTPQTIAPPAVTDEKETSISQTILGTGSTTIVTKSESTKLSQPKIADQEIALSEEEAKPDDGYYKSNDGDIENKNKQTPDKSAVNGAIVVADEVTTLDNRKNNNLETVSIPKTSVIERQKNANLDDGKKAEEKVVPGATGGTYAWSTPEANQNQTTNTKAAGNQSGENVELAKKADKGGKYRAESNGKGKDKVAVKENRADEDISTTGKVAYEPQSVQQDNYELKSETKTTSANNNPSTNNNAIFESTVAADSTLAKPVVSENMPKFIGGEDSLRKFIAKNFNYNITLYKANPPSTNKIFVQFTVGEDGSIKNPKILKGIDPTLDKEAIRVIKMMPKWKPVFLNGKPQSTVINLPIKLEFK